MAASGRPFTVKETHGILLRPEHRIIAASDRLGWKSLYASMQREAPYAAAYAGVPDHLVILHRQAIQGAGERSAAGLRFMSPSVRTTVGPLRQRGGNREQREKHHQLWRGARHLVRSASGRRAGAGVSQFDRAFRGA